jgi:hypothetical protein
MGLLHPGSRWHLEELGQLHVLMDWRPLDPDLHWGCVWVGDVAVGCDAISDVAFTTWRFVEGED